MITATYNFSAEVWLYQGNAPWHFVTLPKDLAVEIQSVFGDRERGWSSLPVTVTIGSSVWETSIFKDKKSESYLLPLKANIRKKEKIEAGANIAIRLELKE